MNVSKDYMCEAIGRAEAIAAAGAVAQRRVEGGAAKQLRDAEGDAPVGAAQGSLFVSSGAGAGAGGTGDKRASVTGVELSDAPAAVVHAQSSSSSKAAGSGSSAAGSAEGIGEAASAPLLDTADDERLSKAGPPGLLSPAQDDYLVTAERKFEVTDLFALFLGPRARTVYVVILSGYMYGALWAYSSVFSSSFSANVPIVFLNGAGKGLLRRRGPASLRPAVPLLRALL